MALQAAGVPISGPVAGFYRIYCQHHSLFTGTCIGLVTDFEKNYFERTIDGTFKDDPLNQSIISQFKLITG